MTATKGRTKWSHLDDIDPAEWSYVGSFYCGGSQGLAAAWDENVNEASNALDASTVSLFNQTGQCDHCGARPLYVCVTRHEPSGDVIAVGHTCTANRFNFSDRAARDIDRLKKAVAAERERAKAAAEAAELRAEFTAEYPADAKILFDVLANPEGRDNFLADLARKFDQYGYLTEGQRPWVQKCAAREVENAERNAKRAEADAQLAPAPEGRVTVRGTIVARKEVDGYFDGDSVTKLLVLADDHYKVWVTAPSGLYGPVALDGDDPDHPTGYQTPERDDRVEFTVTLTRSDDDESFAFGKRPAKAHYVTTEEEA